MITIIRAFLLLALLVPVGWSQSAADLAQKFRHHEVYELKPGVVMSAAYTSSGLVCEMHIEQTHFKKDVVDLRTGLEITEMDALLEQVVPASERGAKEQDEFSRLINISGPTMTRTDEYANVVVQVMWSVESQKKDVRITGPAVLEIKWRNRSCS
jgi:hypothetical protein